MTYGPKPTDETVRFWQHVRKATTGCWEWTGGRTPIVRGRGGYGKFRRNNPRRMELAHRVAWELAHGPIPPGQDVLHSCDNPPCVRKDHLFLGTNQDNSDDMVSKGRRKRKLSDQDVAAIIASPLPSRAIAPTYGVSDTYVRMLRRGADKRSRS